MRRTSTRGVALALGIGLTATMGVHPARAREPSRPNILWITCEDIGPDLGCYGVDYAVTPNLDRLAANGVRYDNAFATIGVCAPARSTIITGMYPPSIGSHHMRCQGTLPEGVRLYPAYLRAAGYYCTNNVKTDYNLDAPPGTWDESSNQAHWRNRKPGQPFFAIFNFTSTHESQIRLDAEGHRERTAGFSASERHDPAGAPLPPYHPDTPEVRADWAHYHDNITFMDKQAGEILAQLEADGLAGDTIVFFYGDHGAGMPRHKRWLYDSGTRVPFLVHVPDALREWAPGAPGSSTDRLISFVDLAPTLLSLAGVPIPEHMQGVAFLGAQAGEPREYVYGFRDRMDERIDMIRMVRDKRYLYIRNYHPELPWFHHQFISYGYEMPTLQVWQRLADAGELDGPAATFMAPSKPTEELYDTWYDPDNVQNLADSPDHLEHLHRLRTAVRGWQYDIVDLGLLPEHDLRSRFGAEPPYGAVRRDPSLYPFKRIAETADRANSRRGEYLDLLLERLDDDDPAIRYWAATGVGSLGPKAGPKAADRLKATLEDDSPIVRVSAADALCRLDRVAVAVPVLTAVLEDRSRAVWARVAAINVLDRLDTAAADAAPVLERALDDPEPYVVRVAEHAVKAFRDGDE